MTGALLRILNSSQMHLLGIRTVCLKQLEGIREATRKTQISNHWMNKTKRRQDSMFITIRQGGFACVLITCISYVMILNSIFYGYEPLYLTNIITENQYSSERIECMH